MGLISPCESATITTPSQTEELNYEYNGTVEFTMNTSVKPDDCTVVYSCLILVGPSEFESCNYKDD